MKAPRRRERDETRVFKKMGDALAQDNTLLDSHVRIQSRPYSDSGPSPLWHGVEGQRMATAGRDSNVETDAERKATHSLREEGIEKNNAHNRKNGRIPVVKIDSGTSKN
jgi:hypothetical protein